MLSYMSGQPRYINHNYDRDGHREHLTFTNDGARFRFYYDGLGRMSAVHDRPDYSSPDDLVVRYFHRPEGPRQVALFGSGSAGLSTGYYYDNVQRLTAIGNDLAPAGADWSIELAYNPAGQIVRRALSNDAYAWTEASSGSLAYETNGLNQYVGVGANRYSYDLNGNLTGDGVATFAYDVENRLVAASSGARLVYDPLGRLAEVADGKGRVTRFQYDGDALIAEYDGAGALLKRYVHGPGSDEPVAVYEGAAVGIANRRYLLADERGSIAALVPTDGTAPALQTYDEWGRPGRNNKGRFQYTGQTYIAELGLYYYKARFYSPTLGRFMQTDPIGYEGGLNIYAYVGNDPINAIDPGGTQTASIGSCPGGQLVSASCRSGGGTTETQTARGGPLNKTKVNPSTLTPQTAANFNSLVLFYGGYYVQGPNGLTWHDSAMEAAIKMGLLTGGILSGEALGALGAGLVRGGQVGEVTSVIGRVKDLQNLGRGEQSLLSRLPNLGNPRANWLQNSGVLRQEMRRGLPIRDASPGI